MIIAIISVVTILFGFFLGKAYEKYRQSSLKPKLNYNDLRNEFEKALLFHFEQDDVCKILHLEFYVTRTKNFDTITAEYSEFYGKYMTCEPYKKWVSSTYTLNSKGFEKLKKLTSDEFIVSSCANCLELLVMGSGDHFNKTEKTINNLRKYLIAKTGKNYLLEDSLDAKFNKLESELSK